MKGKSALQRFVENISIGSLAKKRYTVTKEQLEISAPDPNDRRVKDALKAILDEKEQSWAIMAIHNIQVETKEKGIEITIVLGRPAILVGKHGSNINAIIDQLSSRLESRVYINIVEFDIWK